MKSVTLAMVLLPDPPGGKCRPECRPGWDEDGRRDDDQVADDGVGEPAVGAGGGGVICVNSTPAPPSPC